MDHVWHEVLNPLAFLERAPSPIPIKSAVDYKDKRYTYGEICARVNRLAGALKHAGVRQGDRVAFFIPMCRQCWRAFRPLPGGHPGGHQHPPLAREMAYTWTLRGQSIGL